MEKILKQITLIFISSLILIGCSTKEENKNNSSNNTQKNTEEKSDKKEESTNNTEKQENTTKETTKQEKYIHNFTEAKRLANDAISIQLNSFDIKINNIARNFPGNFATIPALYPEKVRKIKLNKDYSYIYLISLADIIDSYNEYNRNVYNEEDVIYDINKLLSINDRVTYKELEKSSKLTSDEEIKNILGELQTIVYFKGDKVFGINYPMGLGGAGFPQAAEESSWQINGDTLEIPMLSFNDKKEVGKTILKLNNKQYTGGNNNSTYYIYDLK